MTNADGVTHRIVLASEIPQDYPAKREIEESLCSVLLGLPGLWKITVVCSHTSAWWMLHVEGPRFKWMTVLTDARRQSPSDITAHLLWALRASRVLS